MAGTDAIFDDEVLNVRNADVTAVDRAVFDGDVTLQGDLDVRADRIRISANVNTDNADAPDGNVRLNGMTRVLVDNDSVVDVGRGRIMINGGG